MEKSGARVLLIGRRALVVLGLPVLTAPAPQHAYQQTMTFMSPVTLRAAT